MTEKGKKTLVIAVASFFLGGAIVGPWLLNTAKAKLDAAEHPPMPLGTNRLKIGAHLYHPHRSNEFLFTVVDIDPNHAFPDGEVRIGIKVRNATNHAWVWMPRENMREMLVAQ